LAQGNLWSLPCRVKMGNLCVQREDDPEEDRELFEFCVQLRKEVLWRLQNSQRFHDECAQHYREACARVGAPVLSKWQWKEMTTQYIDRLVGGVKWRRERIYASIDSHYPSYNSINEELFTEMTNDMLQLCEQDLTERMQSFQAKMASASPPLQQQHQMDGGPPQTIQTQQTRFPETTGGQVGTPPVPYLSYPSLKPLPAPAPQVNGRGAAPMVAAPTTHQPLSAQQINALHSAQASSQLMPDYSMGAVGIDPRRESSGGAPSLGGSFALPVGGSAPQASDLKCQICRNTGIDPLGRPCVCPLGIPQKVVEPPAASDVDDMKQTILCGELRVSVFNRYLEKESKRLALNPQSGLIHLLREDGLCDDTWEVTDFLCIMEGIDQIVACLPDDGKILENPPPADCCAALKFRGGDDKAAEEEQDLFLCVVFDSGHEAKCATKALNELCQVPIVASQ